MNTSHDSLNALLKSYQRKIHKPLSLKIQFDILPEDGQWFLDLSAPKPLELTPTAMYKPDIIFRCTQEILEQILSGDITGLTAVGRENLRDKTPLDIEFVGQAELTSKFMDEVYEFIQRFFNPTHPEVVIFDRSHARFVHGAWVTPLFYHSGFRSAWYQVEKGQTLNKPLDTNPFPQAFVILSGNGYAKIGKMTIPVQHGRAYYIPPDTEHILWTDDDQPVELMYLAWGDQA